MFFGCLSDNLFHLQILSTLCFDELREILLADWRTTTANNSIIWSHAFCHHQFTSKIHLKVAAYLEETFTVLHGIEMEIDCEHLWKSWQAAASMPLSGCLGTHISMHLCESPYQLANLDSQSISQCNQPLCWLQGMALKMIICMTVSHGRSKCTNHFLPKHAVPPPSCFWLVPLHPHCRGRSLGCPCL